MDFAKQIEYNRRLLVEDIFRRLEAALEPVVDALNNFFAVLFSARLPADWRDQWHAFIAELEAAGYRVEPHRYSSIQHAPLRPVVGSTSDRKYDPTKAEIGEAVYGWVFPNIMLNVYLGQMQTNVVLPVSHDKTRVVFEWFAMEPPADVANDPEWSRLIAFSDEIQDEDVEICETVQRNLRSRVYDRGRYSAKREVGVHHFHSLLHQFLT